VLAVIVEEQTQGFFSSLFRNSEVESKLEEAKRRVENAMKTFQVLISSLSYHYVVLIHTIRQSNQ
jgi:hypothetical protein